MKLVDHALAAAAAGFYVHPLRPRAKLPAKANWQALATTDPDMIRAWWDENPEYNIGIFTGKFRDGALAVIDEDNKGDKQGAAAIIDLALEGYELPETYTVVTPGGNHGRHRYYFTSQPVKSGVNVLGRGVDIRGAGGYVVGAGSETAQGTYQANDAPLQDAPQWLVDRVGQKRQRAREGHQESPLVDQEAAKGRARHYLEHEAPLAIEGQGGDATTFKVCCYLKDLGLTINHAADALNEFWNPRCEPPWSTEELLQKLENAYRYGENPAGSKAPEADFEKIEEVLPETRDQSYLEEINKEHALIYIEGSHFILHETVDERGQPKRVYLTEASFKRKFSPFIVITDGGKPSTQATLWLNWKGRREYAGVCFSPGRLPKHGYYNLWKGFTCGPKDPAQSTPEAREGLRLFMEHTLENVCGGDAALHQWLIGYFAHAVQKPFERPLTTLVFRGQKGTGKNAAIDRVGNLFGRSHYLVAHDGRYLTSNFNGHLDSCLWLVLDEAFWSGDKSAEGKLKGLSTAPTILIERKGKEPYTVDNLVRLVVIGNEEWLVPASADERRYAVFDVGTGRQQQNEYFEKMRILCDEKGGNELLLHTLLKFDLTKVDVNRAPKTEGLLEQKLLSLDLVHEFWLECLRKGEILGADFGEGWPDKISKSTFRNAFLKYKEDRNSRAWNQSEMMIGRHLRRVVPGLSMNFKYREGDRTIHAYQLPPLKEARDAWDNFIGHKTVWE